MTELQASRTLVKSPPELWAECSDAASLGRHLDGFGEIRITRLEPETAVAWEGERARGTVRIEPAGWGTKVILTAVDEPHEPVADAPPDQESPVEAASPEPAPPVAEAPALPPEPAEREPAVTEARCEPAVTDAHREPTVTDAHGEPEPPGPVRKRRFARLKAFWRGEPLSAPQPPVEDVPIEEPPAATPVEEPPEPEARPPATESPARSSESPAPSSEAPAPSSESSARSSDAPSPSSEAAPPVVSDTEAALTAALDSLGQAHHRPYSRA
jgi:hypothetical protein